MYVWDELYQFFRKKIYGLQWSLIYPPFVQFFIVLHYSLSLRLAWFYNTPVGKETSLSRLIAISSRTWTVQTLGGQMPGQPFCISTCGWMNEGCGSTWPLAESGYWALPTASRARAHERWCLSLPAKSLKRKKERPVHPRNVFDSPQVCVAVPNN